MESSHVLAPAVVVPPVRRLGVGASHLRRQNNPKEGRKGGRRKGRKGGGLTTELSVYAHKTEPSADAGQTEPHLRKCANGGIGIGDTQGSSARSRTRKKLRVGAYKTKLSEDAYETEHSAEAH